jgi:hypothetical protein
MPMIWVRTKAEFFDSFCFLDLTRFRKIRIDLPVALPCRSGASRLRLHARQISSRCVDGQSEVSALAALGCDQRTPGGQIILPPAKAPIALDALSLAGPGSVRDLAKNENNVGQWTVNCGTCPNHSTRIARLSSRERNGRPDLLSNRYFGAIAMTKLDKRTIANMDVVLENVCRGLPNSGGDHATRKYVAQKLVQAAKRGNTTLGGLEAVGRRALQEIAQGSTTARAEYRQDAATANGHRSGIGLHR